MPRLLGRRGSSPGRLVRLGPGFRKLAAPAKRRIEAVEEPRGPGRPRQED
jgi:hypothetical protein